MLGHQVPPSPSTCTYLYTFFFFIMFYPRGVLVHNFRGQTIAVVVAAVAAAADGTTYRIFRFADGSKTARRSADRSQCCVRSRVVRSARPVRLSRSDFPSPNDFFPPIEVARVDPPPLRTRLQCDFDVVIFRFAFRSHCP